VSGPDLESLARLLEGSPTKWGHWGPDDEIGALNYLTADEVRAGLATVRDGRVFPLGAPMADAAGDPVFFPGRWAPRHFVVADKAGFRAGHWRPLPGGLEFADDYVTGFAQASTHCDALGHMSYGDKIWNGYCAGLHQRRHAQGGHRADQRSRHGAACCSISPDFEAGMRCGGPRHSITTT
jgi:hypothetical protein